MASSLAITTLRCDAACCRGEEENASRSALDLISSVTNRFTTIHPLFAVYDVGIEDMIPREGGGSDGRGPRLTGGTIALAVVLFLVLVATGAFLVWTFVEQRLCFGRKNAQDYSAIRLRKMQVRLRQVCGNLM